jgi:hypothetical protein
MIVARVDDHKASDKIIDDMPQKLRGRRALFLTCRSSLISTFPVEIPRDFNRKIQQVILDEAQKPA